MDASFARLSRETGGNTSGFGSCIWETGTDLGVGACGGFPVWVGADTGFGSHRSDGFSWGWMVD